MRITIITVCYNRKATIGKAIKSVLKQNYHDVEYIIIDGNSTDGTKEIIESYGDRISQYVSEPDKGMYDAINKGVKLATGDVIGLMHSDDEFYDENAIKSVLKQNYHDVEYIIIDGNSTDGTKEIIESYGDRISQYI